MIILHENVHDLGDKWHDLVSFTEKQVWKIDILHSPRIRNIKNSKESELAHALWELCGCPLRIRSKVSALAPPPLTTETRSSSSGEQPHPQSERHD